MKKLNLSVFFIFIWIFIFPDSYPRNPNIDVINYCFKVVLNDSSNQIMGESTIKIQFLTPGLSQFCLDLHGSDSQDILSGMNVTQVMVEGNPTNFTHNNHRLCIELPDSVDKGDIISCFIKYHGLPGKGLIISKTKQGNRTFFADNWPDHASYWLPSIDHPSDKASCEFIVVAPDHYQVVANGLLFREVNLEDNLRLTHWVERVPIPTKLMVIGVAPFAVKYSTPVEGISLQSWVFSENLDKGFSDFSPVSKVLSFFSQKIGPYAYGKIASVQSKTRFGGMENASAIFYYEGAISGKGEIEDLIAHEMAHQWFGDSVTEGDWHHVWLSEGFATYFTTIYNEFTKEENCLASRMAKARERVISHCKKDPLSSVVDFRIKNLRKLLNTNSYQKGAWVLHMLRRLMGDKLFFKGISLYYNTYKNKTALTEDFQGIMARIYGSDLAWFFKQWVYEPGYPKLNGYWKYRRKQAKLVVSINQIQKHLFRIPLDLGIYLPDQDVPIIKSLELDRKMKSFSFKLATEPVKVVLDPHCWLLMAADFKRRK
jgi:aminopeptidase N